jgi:hypothetical protein
MVGRPEADVNGSRPLPRFITRRYMSCKCREVIELTNDNAHLRRLIDLKDKTMAQLGETVALQKRTIEMAEEMRDMQERIIENLKERIANSLYPDRPRQNFRFQ